MFQRVAEFHRAFGHPIVDTPALPDQSVRDLRQSLLLEELNEFCAAHANSDPVEMADGLADMCYIIAGTALSYGITPADLNFESPYPDDMIVPKTTGRDMAEVLRNSHARYVEAEAQNDLTAIRDTLFGLLLDVCGVALVLGLPLNAVFAEVHRSNMSKLMPDGSVLRREDGKILKSPQYQPPNVQAILERVNTERTAKA